MERTVVPGESLPAVAARAAALAGARVVTASVHEPGGSAGTPGHGSGSAPGDSVGPMVIDGRGGRALAAHAQRARADLVVVTSPDRDGTGEDSLGRVTDVLVQSLRIPVLVLRGGAVAGEGQGTFRRVLVPLDGTPASEDAVDAAAAVAGTRGVTYTLLCVAPPLHPLLRAVGSAREVARDTAAQRDMAECEVSSAVARLRARGYDVAGCVRMDLHPARAILAAADELQADLIAIATHGRGALGRLMHGSVADKVVRGARVPVLLRRRVDAAGELPGRPS